MNKIVIELEAEFNSDQYAKKNKLNDLDF